MKRILLRAASLSAILLSTQAFGAANFSSEIDQLKKEISELKKAQAEQKQLLIDELAGLKLGSHVPELEEGSHSGMGMGASKVYGSKSKVSIGGYGELIYEDDITNSSATTDAYRLVPYIGYHFNDWIIFNSEIEFEHGGANGTSGKAVIEFMYLDFLLSEKANIRVGNYLVPVGITNLKHEPVYFGSVNRPSIEKNLIPSTWHENGILVYGNISEDFSYQTGVFTSPLAQSASSNSNFKGTQWIRGGRQAGAQAKMNDYATVVRLDFTGVPFTEIGTSYAFGDTSQSVPAIADTAFTLWEAHFETQWKDWAFNGLYAQGTLDDAHKLTYAAVSDVAGKEVEGWYATASFDLLSLVSGPTAKLPLFVRYSEYDLHKSVPTGFTKDKSLNKKVTTVGLNYKPLSQVVLKADYQFVDNESVYEGDSFNLGMGFVF